MWPAVRSAAAWSREKYLEQWQKCAAFGDWSELLNNKLNESGNANAIRFVEIYNNGGLQNALMNNEAAEDEATWADYDSFAALYADARDRWCAALADGRSPADVAVETGALDSASASEEERNELEEFVKSQTASGCTEKQIFADIYLKPKSWRHGLKEEDIAAVVRGVLGALADLRSKGAKGWLDYGYKNLNTHRGEPAEGPNC